MPRHPSTDGCRGIFFKTLAVTKSNKSYLRLNKAVKQLLFSISLALFAAPNLHALSPALDDTTNQQLYEHDIKFEGANVHIDGNYQYLLETIVDYLVKHPEIYVHIRGHVCCRSGKRISRRRARNVYRFLKRQGISKDRMTHAGYSDTVPLAFPEKTDEDERVNRRVDFVLSKERIEKN